jgi:hypothetical protein
MQADVFAHLKSWRKALSILAKIQLARYFGQSTFIFYFFEYLKANLITPLGHESTHVEHNVHSE